MEAFQNIQASGIDIRHNKRFYRAFEFMFAHHSLVPKPAMCRRFILDVLKIDDIDEARLLIGLAPFTVHMLYEKVRNSPSAKSALGIHESIRSLPVVSCKEIAVMLDVEKKDRRNLIHVPFSVNHNVIKAVFRKAYFLHVAGTSMIRINIAEKAFGEKSKQVHEELEKQNSILRLCYFNSAILKTYTATEINTSLVPDVETGSSEDSTSNKDDLSGSIEHIYDDNQYVEHEDDDIHDNHEDSDTDEVIYTINDTDIRRDFHHISKMFKVRSDDHLESLPGMSESAKEFYNNRPVSLWKICPMTNAPFCDPVIASDCITYERAAIEAWSKDHQDSPIVIEHKLKTKLLRPHSLIKTAMQEIM